MVVSTQPDTQGLPKPLQRYIPVDADRRLTDALRCSDHELAASALLLARACGLRIGELLDLEIDCVHEIPGEEAWLKVPLGKLDTERMVPLDAETVELVDRIIETRSPGKPLTHPRTGKPAQFLFTHHSGRLAQHGLRLELDCAAAASCTATLRRTQVSRSPRVICCQSLIETLDFCGRDKHEHAQFGLLALGSGDVLRVY